MEIDLELYRQDVRVSLKPLVRLSVIDIAPDQARQTMVFIHGFAGRAVQWKYQLYKFSIANRVVAIDLRGHGLSDKPYTGYGMAQIQSDLVNTLDALGVNEKVILLGHSFGGAVVAEFAATNPSRVSHLVLIASAGEYVLNPLYRFLLKLPTKFLQALTPFTRKWLGAPPQVLKAWYIQNLSTWNGWSMFRDMRVPTLIIRGHQDVIFERSLSEEVRRTIPGSEEADVGASGHMVMLERREAVNRAIERFVEPGKLSFSQSRTSLDETQLAKLIQDRPWLSHYDKDVPFTIAIPRVPLYQLLQSAARRFPSHTALIFGGNHISYRRLNQGVDRFSNALASLGVEKDDRVMLILPNLPQLVIAFFGALKLGAVVVFTLPDTEPDELIRQIQNSEAVVLVVLSQFKDLICRMKVQMDAGGYSPLKHIIFTHGNNF